jgi:hypothetical protein
LEKDELRLKSNSKKTELIFNFNSKKIPRLTLLTVPDAKQHMCFFSLMPVVPRAPLHVMIAALAGS